MLRTATAPTTDEVTMSEDRIARHGTYGTKVKALPDDSPKQHECCICLEPTSNPEIEFGAASYRFCSDVCQEKGERVILR